MSARRVQPGRMHVKGGIPTFRYRNEADIQTAMADLAGAYGWRVQTEVVVPGWGRLDMVLHAYEGFDDYSMVIEFKDELKRLSAIRKAFQQADGYHRWLCQELDRTPDPVLLAVADCDYSLTNDIAYSYRESVNLVSVGEVMALMAADSLPQHRIERARQRAEAAVSSARLHVLAYNTVAATVARSKAEHGRFLARAARRRSEVGAS